MQNSKIALTRGTFPFQTVLCDAEGALPTAEFVKCMIDTETSDDFCSRIARRQLSDAVKRSMYWRTLNVFSTRLTPLEGACIVHSENENSLNWRRFPCDTFDICVLTILSLPMLLSVLACAATLGYAVM